MAVLTAIDPIAGIYSISYEDPLFDPNEAKVGEGTTGKRYASSYMGARSRWWDLSWKQAELEQSGIDRHNKRVQNEILNLQDARANIIQGIPQRYDSMWKHNNTQEQKRLEWNASSGPMSTTTVTDRPARAALVGDRAKGSWYVKTDVQSYIEPAGTDPDATAGLLDAGREDGTLGRDEQSQDQASYYAVQMQIQDRANSKLDAGASNADAWADAEKETLALYDASTTGKDVVARYRRIQSIAERDYGPQRTTTWSTKTGRRELEPYQRTAAILGIDPFSEELTVRQLDEEIAAKEAEIQPDIDLIGRARQVQSEKFGPSLTGALFGGPRNRMPFEQNYGVRSPAAIAPNRLRAAQALETYLRGGGTMDELRDMGVMKTPWGDRPSTSDTAVGIPGSAPVEGAVIEEGEAVAAPVYGAPSYSSPVVKTSEGSEWSYKKEDGAWYTQKDGWAEDKWVSLAPEQYRSTRVTLDAQFPDMRWKGEQQVSTEPAPSDVEVAPSDVEVAPVAAVPKPEAAPVRDPVVAEPVSRQSPEGYESFKRRFEEEDKRQRFGDEIKALEPTIHKPPGPTVPTPEPEEEAEGAEEVEESRIKKALKEMEEATKDMPEVLGRGSPTLNQHRGNLLAGFTGATKLLEKPAKLDRMTANADAGSPQEYARAVIDAETEKAPDQRSTLEEIVSNVAQQYNGMGDIPGRDAALEYTIALYKLFLDSPMLTNTAGGGTGGA